MLPNNETNKVQNSLVTNIFFIRIVSLKMAYKAETRSTSQKKQYVCYLQIVHFAGGIIRLFQSCLFLCNKFAYNPSQVHTEAVLVKEIKNMLQWIWL